MRSKLQYIYSIAVFMGVLLTSYAMMSKDDSALISARAVPSPVRADVSPVEPALAQLLAVQDAIASLRKVPSRDAAAAKATPTSTPTPSPK